MKTATIRDLRNKFPEVARWIEEGESVEITRGGKVFARLSPVMPSQDAAVPMPDFLARLNEYFPGESASGREQTVVDYDRGDR